MVKVKEDMSGWVMKDHGVPDSRLTVIEQAEDYISKSGRHYAQWLCSCSCDNKQLIVRSDSIRNGGTKSCGCLENEIRIANGHKNKKYNTYDLETHEYGVGFTEKGEEFWFDKEDYDLIKNYFWYYNGGGYVHAYDINTKKIISLHRLVMGFPDSKFDIDHKNHPPRNEHKKDNRKSNLIVVEHYKNGQNRSCGKNNTSGVVGVSFNKKDGLWYSYIQVNKKLIGLGYFKEKDDAIKARKEAEMKYFGDNRYDAHN